MRTDEGAPFNSDGSTMGGSIIDSDTVHVRAHGLRHTQHHDRLSYALMAFCQSIITLVAR
jgi:hypothetical protein